MPTDTSQLDFPPTCSPDTVAVYNYWLDRCGERRMPTRWRYRSHGDVAEMAARHVVEVVPDERRFVYRLVGTGEVEVRGDDPTGKSVAEGSLGHLQTTR